MIELKLEKEKADLLANKIIEVTNKFRRRQYIDCIYLNLCEDKSSRVNTAEVTIVCEDFATYEEIVDECKDYNNIAGYKVLKKSGVLIKIRPDYSAKYTKSPINPGEIDRMENLLNARILLDRNNLFTEIKAENTSKNYEYPNNLEIKPSLILKKGKL